MRGEKLFNWYISIIYRGMLNQARYCHNNPDCCLTTAVRSCIQKVKEVQLKHMLLSLVLSILLMCCQCLSQIIQHVLDSVVFCFFPFSFLSIPVFYVSSVLCYNHSNSINSSVLHLPKTWIVSNSFTTIRGSTLQANMSGVEHKGKKKCFHVPMWSLQMRPGTWKWNIV